MPDAADLLSILGMLALAAAAAVAGLFVALAVRRWSQRDEPAPNFTFQDLREMRARGDISESEFAAMRAALLAGVELKDGSPDGSAPRGPQPPRPPEA